ncbi:MAG: flagellar FlbD family protein [Actinobacteria bacterium]|nr:flagellar FlbD family protein [Actinomycetota bacterium]
MMIPLKRLNGGDIAINPDLIERAEVTPDTVITLRDGTKYVVADSLGDLIERVVSFRAAVLVKAQRLLEDESGPNPPRRLLLIPGLVDDTPFGHPIRPG